MAATYKGILTNNGKALIANATVNNKIEYSHIAVGDGNGSVPTPLETRTTLVNEKARIALNVVEINPNNTNQIVCEAIIPSSIGGFFIRELGLYAGTTMVVNASYPPTYKPLADEGAAREIEIKIIINIQNAEVIAMYLDDSLIYATREWVNNNYIRRNELIDNLVTDDAAKPLSAKQGKKLQDEKFAKAGGTVAGDITVTGAITVNVGDATNAFKQIIKANTTTDGGYLAVGNTGSDKGYVEIGAIDDADSRVFARKRDGTNQILSEVTLLGSNNESVFPVSVQSPKFIGGLQGNADTASKLQILRTISFSGAATGSFNFDGSSSPGCILTLANSGVTASTYGSNTVIPVITFNAKGLATGVSTQTIRSASTTQNGIVQLNDTLTSGAVDQALTANQGKVLQDNKLDKTANAVSATKLQTARYINDALFDGTSNITVTLPNKGNISSNAQAQVALSPGQYTVSEWNDNPTQLYSYGIFIVYASDNGMIVHQIYYAHSDNGKGSVQVRQSWDNGSTWQGWRVLDNQFKTTGPYAVLNNSTMPAWDARGGVYQINDGLSSRTVVHFKSGGSTSAFQLLSDYANRGLWYRTSRDSIGFENDFQKILTNTGNQSINGNLTLTDTINISFPDSVGAFKKLIQADTSTDGGYVAVGNLGEDKGFVELGTIDDIGTSIVVRKRNSSNTVLQEAYLLDLQGNTSFPGALTANNGITSNGSLALANQQASSGNGLSLYGGLSGGNGVLPAFGIAFGGTATFGTYGHLDGDWATYFTMDGAARRGWIFKNLSTGVAASINSDGSMAVKNGYFLRSAGATSDFSQGSGIYTGTGDGADYSTHNVAIRSWWGIGFYNNGNTCKLVIDTRTGSISGQGQLNFGGDITSSAWMYAQRFIGSLGGNADTASKLQTARNIAITGAVSGSANFDGSGNITINTISNTPVVRAFINFNMNDGSIRKSSGISSVTNLGNGVYRINLSQNAPDANYAVVGMASWSGAAAAGVNMLDDPNRLPTQNSFCINCSWGGDNTQGVYNAKFLNLAIMY